MWRDARTSRWSFVGGALAGAWIAGLLGFAFALLSTEVIGVYGWGLFVVLPYCQGVVAAAVHSSNAPRGRAESMLVGVASTAISGLLLMGLAREGAICVAMALPIAFGLAALGGLTVHAVASRHGVPPARATLSVVALLPFLMGAEGAADREPPIRAVTTEVVIDAPPEVVWRRVIAFPPLPPPREAEFRAGIAYPVRATIAGRGVGAVRRCSFSTGDFVEPITAWEPGRLLRFDVASQPEPMRELSPWGGVHPPHLDGFLRSRRGEFRLIRLPGGRTLVRGTSWYQNRMWPERYWRAWSDHLMHRIHRRVLRHIERLAERDAGRTRRG